MLDVGRGGACRALRIVGASGVLAFLAIAFTPLPNALSRWFGTEPRLEPADAIVVLGIGGVGDDGTLSPSSLQHTIRGVLLYKAGLAPIVVFSGSRVAGGRIAEAEARARLARQLGIADHAVLMETNGRTTREEALRIAPLLRARRASRVLLVADWDGMGRATRLFERAGFVVLPAPAHVRGWSDSPAGRLRVMQLVLQERLAWLYYRAFGYM